MPHKFYQCDFEHMVILDDPSIIGYLEDMLEDVPPEKSMYVFLYIRILAHCKMASTFQGQLMNVREDAQEVIGLLKASDPIFCLRTLMGV
jgi:hypothetical protein